MSNTRYVDKDGDIWEDSGIGFATCVRRFGDLIEDGATLSLQNLIARHGPISMAPGRCEELRREALETVLTELPMRVGGTGRTDDGTVRVHVPGAGAFDVDVTVREVDA